MAINDFNISDNTIPPSLLNILTKGSSSVRMTRPNNDDDSIKRGKTRKKKASPYLFGEKVQLISRISTEKKAQKKNEIFSSFPLATNIYRASSDEFKALKKIRRKARKSVLTLPNVPAPIPNACTVSDMNDSDYFKNEKKIKPPNRFPKKKIQSRTRGIEFYDRDAHRFDCSSHDILQKNGDGMASSSKGKRTCRADMQDVWSVLRNINKFQFRPTPRISDDDSLVSDRKKTITKKFRTRKGRRLIGTCRTEEVAYVADFEIQSKTSASQSSSFDRITVIDKNDLQNAVKVNNNDAKQESPRRIPYKPKNLIPMHEKKTYKNPPNLKSSQVKENRLVAFIKKQNEQMNKIFTKTVNSTAVNQKRPESTYNLNDSMDSSNCFRELDNEPSNCMLKPRLTITHPKGFKEIMLSGCPQNPINVANNDNALKITKNNQAILSEKITNGTTQMVFNNNKINVDSVMTKDPLKPRLVTTMPSAATMPKLTVADIKRRLANYKFPLVVLGKDEVSSTLEVFDYEPPQFCGLNKHIWPFMLEWKKKYPVQRISPRAIEANTDNLRKATNEIALSRPRDKKTPNVNLLSKKNIDSKRGIQQEITVPPCGVKKIKPMRQLKDKMLKLLYKNTYPGDIDSCQNTEPVKLVPVNDKVDASTEMTVHEKHAIENNKNLVSSENVNKSAMFAPKTPKKLGIGDQNRVPKKLYDVIDNADKPYNAMQALNMKMPGARHPWAKAKWASDFVDNVMRKINNGSYYGIEEQKVMENHDKVVPKNTGGSEEVSIETSNHQCIAKVDFEQNYNEESLAHSLIENDTYDPFLKIPGFDDTLPNLEIKTLNANQIQVKNCLTNVMVQFDVSVPNRTSCHILGEKSSTSSSFIPLSVSESNTRIYKCSTTILNAVLPAELCTVLPKLMQNIFDSNTTLASSLPTLTISEISECESEAKSPLHRPVSPMRNPWMNQFYPPYPPQPHLQNNFGRYPQNKQGMGQQNPWACPPNPWMSPYSPWNCPQNPWTGSPNSWTEAQNPWNGNWIPPYAYGWPEYLPIYMSPRLINYLQGRFGYLPRKPSKRSRIDILRGIKLKYTKDVILPKTLTKTIISLIANPMISMKFNEFKSDEAKVENPVAVNKTVDCTALQLYKPETKWIPSINDFTSLVQKMWNYCKFNVHYAFPKHITNTNTNIITFNRNNITVDMLVGDNQTVKNTLSVTFTHVNNFIVDSNHCVNNETKVIDVVKSPTNLEDYSKDLSVIRDIQLAKKVKEKIRKKSYVNLNRKCKSHIYGDRYYTPLSEISNIDDFTTALGAAKALCTVFDEISGRKILSCIDEMKAWIRDITPGQALLVLLLANKKETPNLLRFRPVLLQGIAVNRITRMTELDMEIEVIERENLELGEREGIACIPASVANQDSLFDELCWIAKTTASDYQKPFDESSERLLRGLLGKRKRLNPSYLRVMARYVGLGLLKKPSKF